LVFLHRHFRKTVSPLLPHSVFFAFFSNLSLKVPGQSWSGDTRFFSPAFSQFLFLYVFFSRATLLMLVFMWPHVYFPLSFFQWMDGSPKLILGLSFSLIAAPLFFSVSLFHFRAVLSRWMFEVSSDLFFLFFFNLGYTAFHPLSKCQPPFTRLGGHLLLGYSGNDGSPPPYGSFSS